jgi:hypothetical protein
MDFVSYDIAKKLKEKGFPQHITDEAYIVDNYGEDECDIGDRLPIPLIPDYMDDIAAPTISQVLKWLREAKKIYVSVEVEREDWFESKIVQTIKNTRRTGTRVYETYAEAVLAGIEYVIDNLI